MLVEPARAGRCPLCGAAGGEFRGRLRYQDIWAGLRDVWHVQFSEEVRRTEAPAETTTLVRCSSCGLERFEPMAPGTPEFYRELMSVVPYNPQRWEFDLVRERLQRDDAVVDLGCGAGFFLRSLADHPGRTAGIDHHSPSIERLRADGLEAYSLDFRSFAEQHRGRFDVATCFHVIEHVSDPVSVAVAARACLRPGGRFFVSVPNRERALRSDIEPLDAPPHHVTRWAPAQLEALAGRSGFRLSRIRFEPPPLSVFYALAQRAFHRRFALVPTRPRTYLAQKWSCLAVGPRRYGRMIRTERFASRGVFGHSMLAELEAT
jgi:SAM-dependent methyltransferase